MQDAQAGLWRSLFGSGKEDSQVIFYPRKSLKQAFAVLLLRSVYEAADSMDFIPMVCPAETVALSTTVWCQIHYTVSRQLGQLTGGLLPCRMQ